MSQHRSGDVGVVDLLARRGHLTAQLLQKSHDSRTIFEDLELLEHPLHIVPGRQHIEGRGPVLWSSHGCQVFADDLTADPEPLAAGERSRDRGAGDIELGRLRHADGDEHVSVYEQWWILSPVVVVDLLTAASESLGPGPEVVRRENVVDGYGHGFRIGRGTGRVAVRRLRLSYKGQGL